MAAETGIDWCDSTFNPWIGCTKVSPACDHCYAAVSTPVRALGVEWGVGKLRLRTSAANWAHLLRWNARPFWACEACGWRGDESADLSSYCPKCKVGVIVPARRRVFCASLGDWLDNEVPADWLADLLSLIASTPNLDWLLLTKRIGNWRSRIAEAVAVFEQRTKVNGDCRGYSIAWNWLHTGTPPANVWIGSTICNQAEADRDVLKLLRVPAAVRFLSIEPMLGPIDLERVYGVRHNAPFSVLRSKNPKGYKPCVEHAEGYCLGGCEWRVPAVDWVIVGGESGAHARPMHPDWARSLRDQCAAAGIAFNLKQWGEWLPVEADGDWPITACDGTDRTFPGTTTCVTFEGHDFARVGKKSAGRKLDGRIHHEFPRIAA